MTSFIPTSAPVLTVSELNRHARATLEQNFPLLWVSGEISNFTRAASGHWYFSLKDSQAQVRCAMFRHKSQYIDFKPENGMQVEVRALVTLYEARGEYQLAVESMRRAGLGALFEAFEKLKARLAKEGLFDEARKKTPPAFPRSIGIVTSPAAAALRDVLTTLRRRMPSIPVILYPTPVQGEGAAASVALAIATAAQRAECDVLIVCRGGGSIEDLWAFNEEIVARAIISSPIPVICGIGHETDFTIGDFVADRRAPTPTAAAELATPSRIELAHRVGIMHSRLRRLVHQTLEQRMQQADYLARRLVHPGARIENQRQHLSHLQHRFGASAQRALVQRMWNLQQLWHRLDAARPKAASMGTQLDELGRRLQHAMANRMQQRHFAIQQMHGSLAHLNPQSVLQRGFSVVRTTTGGIVHSSREIALDEQISLTFASGSAAARVTRKEDAP